MTDYIDTTGGVPTRGGAYAKLIHHLREAENQAYVLSHLHNTEDDQVSKGLAKLWLMAGEQIKHMILRLTELAKGNLQ